MAVDVSLHKLLTSHRRIALDTNLFIYALQKNPSFAKGVGEIFDAIRTRALKVSTSIITLLEMSVKFFREEKEEDLPILLEFLTGNGKVNLIDVNQTISLKAAELRAHYRLKVADAIQLATAIYEHATLFLTADQELEVVSVGETHIHVLAADHA